MLAIFSTTFARVFQTNLGTLLTSVQKMVNAILPGTFPDEQQEEDLAQKATRQNLSPVSTPLPKTPQVPTSMIPSTPSLHAMARVSEQPSVVVPAKLVPDQTTPLEQPEDELLVFQEEALSQRQEDETTKLRPPVPA